MKALILVGGYGTRLRPLTLSCPKPLVEFANKPMIIHQIQALKEVGCTEVILAIAYQPEVMLAFKDEWEARLDIKITISQENEPMGTAGPLALARDLLDDGSNEHFFVLNSDVICEFPLNDLLEFHKSRGGEGTLLVTKVEDPSRYGVVVTEADGKINAFMEKPKEFVSDKINAGIYVLSPRILRRIELRPTSIEREVFPAVAADGLLYAMVLQGYWMDIGQPTDFLKGLSLHLESMNIHSHDSLASGPQFVGNVLMHPSAKIGEDCLIGPDVAIGEDCEIGDGVRLSTCVLMRGVKVKKYAKVVNSIVGWHSRIGAWSRVENKTILGENVGVKDELYVNGAIVLPHKDVKESIQNPQIVL
ncbi:unnamed protein product [Ostreobium quekettii]|uniref:mannose-1-phosphate guanylyltransferase n=1 Tax=Ostreobium quekettii TaxID=121088 RepID=A0A8S1IU94_9CHLO|nr:unnamed protein product [Ostreobium quekettii]|eukprot:evm.model.scf_425EXC.3 EVM.evm.TU.scf_425EXC.3   scf_425EXC:13645-17323(+)